jgi:hypothetical protein
MEHQVGPTGHGGMWICCHYKPNGWDVVMIDFLLCTDIDSSDGTLRLSRMRALARACSHRGHSFIIAAHGPLKNIGGLDPAWKFAPVPDDYDCFGISHLARQHRVKIMILDLPRYNVETLATWRAEFCIAAYMEGSVRILPADLIIHPSPEGLFAQPGSDLVILGGPEYALVERGTDLCTSLSQSRMPTIAVTTWLHDPEDLTSRVLRWLGVMDSAPEITVLAGPEYRYHDVLADVLSTRYANITVQTDLTELPRTLAAHRVAIASEGTLLYQLAALGVPTVCIVQESRAEPIARLLIERGAAFGITPLEAERGGLTRVLHRVLYDAETRERMVAAGQAVVDGFGAERVVQAFEQLLGRCPRRAVA